MATKQRADKQKEKERKEKILLAVLVVILIIVGAIMLPGMLKKKGNLDQAAAQPAVTSPTSTTAGGTPADGSATGGTPSGAASAAAAAVSFPSTPGYQAEAGQLSKFGLFASRDPFGNAPGSSTETGTTTPTTGTGTGSSTTTTTQKEAYAVALISINGSAEAVNLGASFPAASPLFSLTAIAAKSATISVAGGSFSNGRSTVKIQKGHTLVLENTADGTRYAIKLISSLKSGAVVPVVAGPGTSTSTDEETTTGGSTTGATTTTGTTTTASTTTGTTTTGTTTTGTTTTTH